MAKKKRHGGREGGTRRGGRKRGTWTLVTPDSLRAWRTKSKISRAKVAAMLSVSEPLS